MADDSLHKIDTPSDLQKSIFPVFEVNVPMPRDTALPGSFGQNSTPAQPQGGAGSQGGRSAA